MPDPVDKEVGDLDAISSIAGSDVIYVLSGGDKQATFTQVLAYVATTLAPKASPAFTGTVTAAVLGPHGGTRLTANSGAFDLSAADWFFRTLDGTNGTLTVSNDTKSNMAFVVELLQDGTGAHTVSFGSFGTITWMTSGAAAPTTALAAGLRMTLLFKRIAAGTFLAWVTGDQS